MDVIILLSRSALCPRADDTINCSVDGSVENIWRLEPRLIRGPDYLESNE